MTTPQSAAPPAPPAAAPAAPAAEPAESDAPVYDPASTFWENAYVCWWVALASVAGLLAVSAKEVELLGLRLFYAVAAAVAVMLMVVYVRQAKAHGVAGVGPAVATVLGLLTLGSVFPLLGSADNPFAVGAALVSWWVTAAATAGLAVDTWRPRILSGKAMPFTTVLAIALVGALAVSLAAPLTERLGGPIQYQALAALAVLAVGGVAAWLASWRKSA